MEILEKLGPEMPQRALSIFKLLSSESVSLPHKEETANDLILIADVARRELSREQFSALIDALTNSIRSLIFSQSYERVQGGLFAILNLIGVRYEENEKKCIKFANYIRHVLGSSNSVTTLNLAATAFGKLADSENNLNLDFVEFEIRRSFEWLRTKGSSSHHLHAAALIIREAAECAPSVLLSHGEYILSNSRAREEVFQGVRNTLFHSKEVTRAVGAEALNSSLRILETRSVKVAHDIHVKLYKEIVCSTFGIDTKERVAIKNSSRHQYHSTRKDITMESKHGALLTLGVLIERDKDFSESWFIVACSIVLEFRKYPVSDKLRTTAINLIPSVAGLFPERFSANYLRTALQDFLFVAFENPSERLACFNSMGKLALVVGDGLMPYVAHQVVLAHHGLVDETEDIRNGALRFVALLTRAVGQTLTEHGLFDGMLTNMFLGGLNKTLVASLANMEENIPSLRPYIHAHLIHTLSLMLSGSPFLPPEGGQGVMKTLKEYAMLFHYHQIINQTSEFLSSEGRYPERDPKQIALALKVLSGFNFEMLNLLPFLSEIVVSFLTHMDESVRIQAIATCSKLLRTNGTRFLATNNRSFTLCLHVMSKVLSLAITDQSSAVRVAAIGSISPAFDLYLAPKEMVHQACLGLGDRNFEVRRGTLRLLIRLTRFNPGHVLPALHRTMVSLLQTLEIPASTSREKQEAALMLGDMVYGIYSPKSRFMFMSDHHYQATALPPRRKGSSAGVPHLSGIDQLSQLILPHVPQALGVLYSRLITREPMGVVTAVLRTIGSFALVNQASIGDFVKQILPNIVEALQDQSSVYKRKVALKTLTLLVRTSAHVVEPFVDHPGLLDSLLSIMNGGISSPPSLRRYALQALGTVGALDPFRNRTVRQGKAGQHALPPSAEGDLPAQSLPRRGKLAGEPQPAGDGDPRLGPLKQKGSMKEGAAKSRKMLGGSPTTGQNLAGAGEGIEALKLANQQGRGNLAQYLEEPNSIFPPSSSHRDYYPAVVILKLTEILWDESLSANHPLAILALNHIFASTGLGCVRFLPKVMPCLFDILHSGEVETRRQVLQILAVIVSNVKQHILPYMNDLTECIVVCWDEDLEQVTTLVEETSNALSYEFEPWTHHFVQNILESLKQYNIGHVQGGSTQPSRQLLQAGRDVSIEGGLTGSKPRIGKLVQTIRVLGSNLSRHFEIVVPELLKVVENSNLPLDIRESVLNTLIHLSICNGFDTLLTPVFFTLENLLRNPESRLRVLALQTVSVISRRFPQILVAFQRGLDAAVMNLTEDQRTFYLELKNDVHSHVAGRLSVRALQQDNLTRQVALDQSSAPNDVGVVEGGIIHGMQQPNWLTDVWDNSRCKSKEDWHAWFWDLALALLRESPQPAMRACRELAQVYRQLAYSLFNAAFLSCWMELPSNVSEDATRAIVHVYREGSAPAEILQAFLNLAEYMEHDDQTLNIDLRTMCFYATNCQLYAKALHYKELEFNKSPSTSIEDLIAINTKLNQPDMAIGVLMYALLQRKVAKESCQSHGALLVGNGAPRVTDLKDGYRGVAMNRTESTRMLNELMVSGNGPSVPQAGSRMDSVMENAPMYPAGGGSNFDYFKVQESWFEQLGCWEEAKDSYEQKLRPNPDDPPLLRGLARCLSALGEHDKLLQLAEDQPGLDLRRPSLFVDRKSKEGNNRSDVAVMLARSAWAVGRWTDMEAYLQYTTPEDLEGSLLRIVLALHKNQLKLAQSCIAQTRAILDRHLTALVGESYERAYRNIVVVQQVAELEEVCQFKRQLELNPACKKEEKMKLHRMWSKRLQGCQHNVEVWQSLLTVRSLVLSKSEDTVNWIKFASICRKQQRTNLARRTLLDLGVTSNIPKNLVATGDSPAPLTIEVAHSFMVRYAHVKRQWAESQAQHAMYRGAVVQKRKARSGLNGIIRELEPYLIIDPAGFPSMSNANLPQIEPRKPTYLLGAGELVKKLQVRCRLKFGDWTLEMADHKLNDNTISTVKEAYQVAVSQDNNSYKATQKLALMNFRVVQHYRMKARLATHNVDNPNTPHQRSASKWRVMGRYHTVPAMQGFFRAISLKFRESASGSVEDLLRLLTLWFDYSYSDENVIAALREGLESLPLGTWLTVIPQLIARINTTQGEAKDLLLDLLLKLGKEHPHSVIYPIFVALSAKETSAAASENEDMVNNPAQNVLDDLHRVNPELVRQASLVSSELIRTAILWAEEWQDALDNAAKLYFSYRKPMKMIQLLAPLHARMQRGASTMSEHVFLQECGGKLADAWRYMENFQRTGKELDAEEAWVKYRELFNWCKKLYSNVQELSLDEVAPRLAKANNLTELAVPGTYRQGMPIVSIQRFQKKIELIQSKHHPRKIVVEGNNGAKYKYLLKGHEDLRQDERVMQLFGLINALLKKDYDTFEKDVEIQRYAVVPLSPNVGISSWLVHADTLHSLIKGYREARNIVFNIEYRLINRFAPPTGYSQLTVAQKLEAFQDALENTTGSDINKVLWHTSVTCEVWLERRTNYSRSLATMCMVGYILGLGDRHPENIMLDRHTGKVIHIDFGDCFEVAIHRERYPERVPFRLTRMLIKALEVSGIEGNFRYTCQHVMRVLRDNRDSVMSMLEAFVHEPLIHWRMQMGHNSAQQSGSDSRPLADDQAPGPSPVGRGGGEDGAGGSADQDESRAGGEGAKTTDFSDGAAAAKDEAAATDQASSAGEPGQPFDLTRDAAGGGVAAHRGSLPGISAYSTKLVGRRASHAVVPKPRVQDSPVADRRRPRAQTFAQDGMQEQQAFQIGSVGDPRDNARLLRFLDEEGLSHQTSNKERNQTALEVIQRVEDKLTGKDFGSTAISVDEQVQRLIVQATDHVNLCQAYFGWCAFW